MAPIVHPPTTAARFAASSSLVRPGPVARGSFLHVVSGDNANIGSTIELVWANSSAGYTYPTSGVRVEAISSSAQDDVGGTGVARIRFEYLDWPGYRWRYEDLELNGVAAVLSRATNVGRPLLAYAIDAGTSGSAVGNVTIRDSTGSPIYDYIPAGTLTSKTAHFTVPAGMRASVVGFDAFTGISTSALFELQHNYHYLATLRQDTLESPGFVPGPLLLTNGNAVAEKALSPPIELPEKTDIRVVAARYGASTTLGACNVYLLLSPSVRLET